MGSVILACGVVAVVWAILVLCVRTYQRDSTPYEAKPMWTYKPGLETSSRELIDKAGKKRFEQIMAAEARLAALKVPSKARKRRERSQNVAQMPERRAGR